MNENEIVLPKFSDLWQTIGKNCRIAREVAGFTRLEVIEKLYGFNDKKAYNYLADLEVGHRTCTFAYLVRLSLLYKSSLNFLTGLSKNIEINIIDKKSLVLNTIESSTEQITQKIHEQLSNILKDIPKQRGELLLNISKQAVKIIHKQQQMDLIFSANYPDVIDFTNDLQMKINDFDETIRRYYRYAELNLIQQTDKEIDDQLGQRLTDQKVLEEPQKLKVNAKYELPPDEFYLKLIGNNCKIAREWSGINRDVVMKKVWNYADDLYNNRIVELENGVRVFSLSIMIKIASLYNCSLDFIAGLSNEVELNAASSSNGIILQSMRAAALDMADSLSKDLFSLMDYFPKHNGELLKLSAQRVVNAIMVHKADRTFASTYPAVLEIGYCLQNEVQAFESLIARFHRYAELNIYEKIEEFEKNSLSKKSKNKSRSSRA